MLQTNSKNSSFLCAVDSDENHVNINESKSKKTLPSETLHWNFKNYFILHLKRLFWFYVFSLTKGKLKIWLKEKPQKTVESACSVA